MPTTATPDTASELAGQPFGQVWDESQMCPGALRAIAYGREVDAKENAETKRKAKNAKAKAVRAAKKAAAATVVVDDAPVATVVEPAPPTVPEPALPPVLVHGNYKLQTATGRVKYGNFEITEDLNAASLHVTPATLRRLPASPRLVNRSGTLHLTDAAMNEFKRVLS
jgi:hypothetical protein